jgi:hypothetical protein
MVDLSLERPGLEYTKRSCLCGVKKVIVAIGVLGVKRY